MLKILLVALLILRANAGNKESQACNMCRKDWEPPSHKFPEGYSNCGEYLGSALCPIINTDEGGDTMHTSAADDCHTNPYDQECSKWERKYGDKFNSTKNQGGNTAGIAFVEFMGALALIGFVFLFFMIVARSSSSSNNFSTQYNITTDIESG